MQFTTYLFDELNLLSTARLQWLAMSDSARCQLNSTIVGWLETGAVRRKSYRRMKLGTLVLVDFDDAFVLFLMTKQEGLIVVDFALHTELELHPS